MLDLREESLDQIAVEEVRCSITTIDQADSRLAGVKMSEMLLALGKGVPVSELQVLWQPRLLAGDSVGHR